MVADSITSEAGILLLHEADRQLQLIDATDRVVPAPRILDTPKGLHEPLKLTHYCLSLLDSGKFARIWAAV
jgi:hypothetical protein